MSEDRELPVTFSSFIGSLFGSAMVHLGEAEDPASRTKQVDLTLARNTIDLLGVLKEKTQGNLDDEESRFLDSVLYECRTKFIEKSGGS